MKKRILLMLMAVVPMAVAMGYSVDTKHPPFYFEDREVKNRNTDGTGWFQDNTIYNVTNHSLTDTSGPNCFGIVVTKPGVVVKGWGISPEMDLAVAVWDYTATTNYPYAYDPAYADVPTVYLYVWLKWLHYDLVLDPNVRSLNVVSHSDVCYTNGLSLAEPGTRPGYTFRGWTNETFTTPLTGTKTGEDLHVAEDGKRITLYGKWTVNTYTVTFNANGEGATVSPSSRNAIYDSTYGDLPTPTRAGYAFGGWWTAASGGVRVESNTPVAITSAQTLYAHWTALTSTVTFDANGEGAMVSPATTNVVYGSTYGDLPTPTWAGYAFGGWWTAASGGERVESGTPVAITSAQTLYAHWTSITRKVTFNPNGADATVLPATTNVIYGSTYGSLPTPTRAGYAFGGWWTAASGGERIESNTPVTISSAQTLYAHWTANTYTVMFDANGAGATVSPSSTNVIYGSTYGRLPTPTRTGYAFGGWWTAASGGARVESNATVTITSNQTLYAHWTALTSMVTFNANGADATVSPPSTNVVYGSTYGRLPTPTRVGYAFGGWWTAASGGERVEANTSVAITSAQTLYARWTALTSTVTFNANGAGATVSPATTNVAYGSTYGRLPTPTRAGYAFGGWWTAASGGEQVESNDPVEITSAQTLYAHWTIITSTVTFIANGAGAAVSPATTNVAYGSTYGNLPTPTRAGYAFGGWWTAASGGARVESNTRVAITSAQKLYARWTVNTYKVTFDKNGTGTPVSPSSTNVVYGSTYGDLPTPTWAGHAFGGWWTATNGGERVEFNTVVTNASDQTLYACWTANTYKVTFNANGAGATVSSDFKNVIYGSIYGNLPTPTRVGYAFGGWWTAASGGARVESGTMVTITSNQTLYARWSSITHEVTFNVNGMGASVSPATTNVIYGSTYGRLPTPTRAGYAFGGWWTAASGGERIESNAPVAITSAQTLYAHWTALTYTVTFIANGTGAAVSPAFMNVVYDATYGSLPRPTRTGYTFGGWRTAASGGENVESNTTVTITSAQTLYAHWTANTYTVTFNANGAGATVSPSSTNVVYDSTYGDLPTPTWGERAFDGWWTAASGGERVESSTVVTITSNQTLYARWTKSALTVTFYGRDEINPLLVTNVMEGTAVTPPDPKTPGYTFRSWVPADFNPVISNMIIRAQYDANRYTVVYDANGGSGMMTNDVFTYDVEYQLQSNAYERAMYEFFGWASRPDASTNEFTNCATVVNLTDVAGATNTFYAVWGSLLTPYSIAVDCTNLVLDCTNLVNKWAIDYANGFASTSSVYVAGRNIVDMTATLSGMGTLMFRAKCQMNSSHTLVNVYVGDTPEEGSLDKDFVKVGFEAKGDWVAYSLVPAGNKGFDVTWAYIGDNGDECWIDQVNWYPEHTVVIDNAKLNKN